MASVGEMAHVSNMACVGEMASVSKMACVGERPCMGEAPCVRGTACVRARYEREMVVGMQETATACPSEGVMARWVSVVNASVRA